jgi:predicted TIM-barrel fold metal-dependent hydrolase
MTTTTGTAVFDSCSYVLEPPAIWEQHLDPAYRVAARSAFYFHMDPSGVITTIVNGKSAKPLNASRLFRQAIWRPGMTVEQIGDLDPRAFHPINPGAWEAKARLKDMDAMGIGQALLFPTTFAEYFPLVENPDLAQALARAYNDWLLAFASADPKRLAPVAVLPMQDTGFAIAELRRIAKAGFKAVFIRPAYYSGGFLSHKRYNPLWQELETLDVAACIHASPGSASPEWTSTGPYVERVALKMAIGHNVAEAVAPAMDNATALSAFAFCGHMEDYPKLKLAFAGSGAALIPLTLEKSETYLTVASYIRDVSLEPEHIFLERPSLATFDTWESTVARLHDLFSPFAAWGSRYPHHDASTAHEALAMLKQHNVPPEATKRLMGGNIRAFLGVS